jgi:sporulation protein YlmC with PRC-barrel domain
MLNKLMLGVALSAFALSGAMAQSSPSPSSPSPSATPPAASSPSTPDASKSSTSGAATTSSPSASASSSGGAKFVSTQSPDQFLASKFKGLDVVGSDDKKIGDVSDILFDKEGKIEAYVVSVGGFLGVGSKDVALAPTAFEVVKGANGTSDKLKLAMSKDELKQAQNFEPYKAPASTTGAGSRPGGMGPAGGGMKPASPSK